MTQKDQDKDVQFIQALAELLQENDLTELEVKRDYGPDKSLNVRVSRQTVAAAPSIPQHIPIQAPLPNTPAIPEPPSKHDATPETDDPAEHPGAVTSPMVGTAYLAAEPGAAPFVSVGASVSEGQTLLIVEAMKTMNQIPAPKSGKITRILIEDGSPVEFGSPLMIIE